MASREIVHVVMVECVRSIILLVVNAIGRRRKASCCRVAWEH